MIARRLVLRAIVALAAITFHTSARADISLDVEVDPLPLVEITVVVPAGF